MTVINGTPFHLHSFNPRSTSCHPHLISNLTRFPFRIAGLLASYTNCQIPLLNTNFQFEIAHQLVLQSCHTPGLNIHYTPTSTLALSGTYNFLSVLTILLQTKNTVFLFEIFNNSIFFYFISLFLRRSPADPTTRSSVFGKCRSVPPPSIFV